MTDYVKTAKEFLKEAAAEVETKYLGVDKPNWDPNNYHDKYEFTIKTSRGSMSDMFYDSVRATEVHLMTVEDYCKKYLKMHYNSLTIPEQTRAHKNLKELKQENAVSEYDILSCLEKYPCGTFQEWCRNFGYSDDSIKALNTYQACAKQYEALSKVFTQEQLEKLREIN